MLQDRQLKQPTNAEVAELLNIPEDQVNTYRLDTANADGIWRISLAIEILSPLRARSPGEKLPANLVLEIPITDS